ncbi:MAG: methionyl-tRNA formyltransferase [Dehalococcoidia bacterium]|nr:MAG: methionyl-tRNA formyltransferase [Chloroflexota bacterium]|tara:strand:- start:11328 stop:12248 length:921 start_codon:yes stop_codon:yes gene_type:complete
MRIVFFATSDESLNILQELSVKHDIVAVISKKPNSGTKRRNFSNSKILEFASDKYLTFEPDILDKKFEQKIENLKPDLSVVVAYGKILKKSLIETPKFGTINIHPSLLPKYRGPSPVQNTIINQDLETGFTIIQMDEGIDTGDILYKSKKFKLSLKEKYSEVLSFLFSESSIIINKLLNDIEKNKIKPEVQNIDEASYTTLIKKQSASINWSEPSEVIFAKFRAFYNWPNLYSYHLGKRFIINDLDLSDYKSEVAGKIEKINGSLYIHTSSNMLCIKIIQFEGKKPVQALAYFNNFDLSKTILETK